MPKRILSKNAIPQILPHLGENSDFYDDAINIRKNVESILDDHHYFGRKTRKSDVEKCLPKADSIAITDVIDSTINIETKSTDRETHLQYLENLKLKAQLEESIKRIEKEQEKNRILEERNRILEEERANNLLPKDLFKKIFGEDQIKYLRTGRVKKWSDDTIKKALKLRYAAGTRGNFF